jgi:hemerythrin-like domain-containing protein
MDGKRNMKSEANKMKKIIRGLEDSIQTLEDAEEWPVRRIVEYSDFIAGELREIVEELQSVTKIQGINEGTLALARTAIKAQKELPKDKESIERWTRELAIQITEED